MHLIVYGPEGSGKGTQAKLLSDHFQLPVYTSGDLVRERAKDSKSKIGKACKEALEKGHYVSDKLMFILWEEMLKTKQAKEGFILDGFPRNLNQAKFLLAEVKKNNYTVDKVIYIKLSDEEATNRLLKRNRKLFEGSLESHDSLERVHQRLKVYREKEKELLKFFSENNLLIEINGGDTREGVFLQIKEKVEKFRNKGA